MAIFNALHAKNDASVEYTHGYFTGRWVEIKWDGTGAALDYSNVEWDYSDVASMRANNTLSRICNSGSWSSWCNDDNNTGHTNYTGLTSDLINVNFAKGHSLYVDGDKVFYYDYCKYIGYGGTANHGKGTGQCPKGSTGTATLHDCGHSYYTDRRLCKPYEGFLYRGNGVNINNFWNSKYDALISDMLTYESNTNFIKNNANISGETKEDSNYHLSLGQGIPLFKQEKDKEVSFEISASLGSYANYALWVKVGSFPKNTEPASVTSCITNFIDRTLETGKNYIKLAKDTPQTVTFKMPDDGYVFIKAKPLNGSTVTDGEGTIKVPATYTLTVEN